MEISYLYSQNDWKNELYRFHLDVFKKEHGVIKGWLVLFDDSVDLLFEYTTVDGVSKKEKIDFFHFRPKLKEIYPEVEGVEFSGFEINVQELKGFKEGRFLILVNSAESEIAKACVKPPLLYVHIAKTAGSTVNKVLVDLFGKKRSIVHAESVPNWKVKVENDELCYLSGHIPFSVFNESEKVKGFKKAITFREPYSHVVSHLCWIRALSLEVNEERYNSHPEYIQKLSDKLSLVDFSSPKSIEKLIEGLDAVEFRLLDNTQSRYIRKGNSASAVSEKDLEGCFENLQCFDFVGVDKDISNFLKSICDYYDFEKQVDLKMKENVSRNNFGFDLSSEELKKSLLPLIRYDLFLYDSLVKVSNNV
ncbi:hypothetical protein [Marinomonas shanghaiensis]|uniref:hypothetical protein n=1 Tax=Marinomonas shanghaiensis TaxID=2202418 RepID=UPI003A95C9F8